MAILQKLDILAHKLKTEVVDVPEWGGEVIVSELGASDSIAMLNSREYVAQDGKTINMATFTPALVACCVVDESGQRIFTDEDVAALARCSPKPFDRVSTIALRLNGLIGVDETVKNSEPGPSDGSSSV